VSTPFVTMASVLVRNQPAAIPQPVIRVAIRGRYNGKTAMLRHALDHGRFTAQELASFAGLSNSGLVYALLKADMRKGLVSLSGGIYSRGLA
jgi:Fe-S oxidoreductase